VVTFLRDDSYLPLLQQLECTLRRSNPGLELGLMMVPGELSEGTLALAAALNITLLPVEPLQYRNTYEARWVLGGVGRGSTHGGNGWRQRQYAGVVGAVLSLTLSVSRQCCLCCLRCMFRRCTCLAPHPPLVCSALPQVWPQLAQSAGAGADPVRLPAAGGQRCGSGGPHSLPLLPASRVCSGVGPEQVAQQVRCTGRTGLQCGGLGAGG
jgi:hypothetical protein